jgi:hypothetical protein
MAPDCGHASRYYGKELASPACGRYFARMILTTAEVERRYAEMRAAALRQEALTFPESSQERQDALYLAWMQQDRADRLARPAGVDENER